jgi:quercetin dioxygenase-like cupin family protein
MTEPQHYTTFEAERFGDEAPGVSIRWVIDRKHGAENYALRVIEVGAGGHTPHHTHWFEHENFVIEGQGEVQIGDEIHAISPGDVVFVPGDVEHQYRNTGQSPLKFLCGIPMEWIKDAQSHSRATDDA